MSVRSAPAGIDQKMLQMALAAEHEAPIDVGDESALGEGATGYANASKDTPLNRKVTVAIRASLAELSTNAARGVWAPTKDQLENIYQQKQFVDLSGDAKKQGDLQSVVLHGVEAKTVQSSFPISVGAKITGVDERSFSSIGNAFSMITLPNAKGIGAAELQKEDTAVAYDFARRYPGYNANNLETNGVHAVPTRKFVLVAATHPLVTAIHENADQLQTAEITQMPEQLIKISTNLYDTLMPLVKQQVASQIKVTDLSNMSVSIQPADYPNWSAAADALTREAVAPLKTEHRRALRKAGDDQEKIAAINEEYGERIEAEQSIVANTPLEFHLELSTDYNFL